MSDISRLGNISVSDNLKDYIVVKDSYDNSETYETGKEDDAIWTGHTWKPYYFYYDDRKGDFTEYDCIKINRSKLAGICGFDPVSEIESEGYEVSDILMRDNGIININYSKKELDGSSFWITYKNASYDLNRKEFINAWGDGENTWQASDYGGIYLKSILNEEKCIWDAAGE